MPPDPAAVLVVVSYYDARPQQELEALLHDLATVPAGAPFDVLVVVNQERAAPTVVRTTMPRLRVLHRPNGGYNIGAWEHGWRVGGDHAICLFLQHECRVRRPGWLAPFVRRLRDPGVGLVGERVNPAWAAPWPELERRFQGHSLPDHHVDGVPAPRLSAYRRFFAEHGIEPGERGDHLQTLVLAARRETLLRIGGFPIGRDYGEAIAAEIGISKRVQTLGLATEQIGALPFTWFFHPQWQGAEREQRPPAPRLGLGRWLEQVRAERRFPGKPWLVLGKGPTFAQLTQEHRAAHHLFGLNHVVREVQLEVAHAIDIDVISSCRAVVADHCRYLLMPRVPHQGSAAGSRLLEDWFDELPELWELERAGRLVWYNCSTGRAQPGSPVIEVRYFSSEAAFDILGRLGARTVRSLGIDGGRGYSGSFADLAGTTRLQNGQPLFDLQFERLRAIVARHGMDWTPLAEPVHVCIAMAAGERLAAKVLEYTLRKHASLPLRISLIAAGQTPPEGAIVVPAAALACGDVAAGGTAGSHASWLRGLDGAQPWHAPGDDAAAGWLDAFAEAVNAGIVSPRDVAGAIAARQASPRLRHLPAPRAPGGDAHDSEHRAACLRRELANLRLSLTFRIGRILLRPASIVHRAWSRLVR